MGMTRSENMRRIRQMDTMPERVLASLLWATGIRYREQRLVEGVRADFVVRSRRLAIFVDGCFWHGRPVHGVLPRADGGFWRRKIEGNRARDTRQRRRLRATGWTVIHVWEHELKKPSPRLLQKLNRLQHSARQ